MNNECAIKMLSFLRSFDFMLTLKIGNMPNIQLIYCHKQSSVFFNVLILIRG